MLQKEIKLNPLITRLLANRGIHSKEDAKLSKKEYKQKIANRKFPSVSYEIADMIQKWGTM